MFQEETVFVLGAGSNLDYGFVTGAELKTRIKDCLDGDVDSNNALMGTEFFLKIARSNMGFTPQEALDASRKIRRGLDGKDSIDDYLHVHRTDQAVNLLGKYAIVHCILQLEQDSKLSADPELMTRKGADFPWGAYDLLWGVLTKGVVADALVRLLDDKFSPVTMITFNYDRSLEQFLFCKFVMTYGLPIHEAEKLVRGLNILHAYGSVGKWIYPHCAFGAGGVPFGGKVMSDRLVPLFGEYKMSPSDDSTPLLKRLAAAISTYTQEADSEVRARIKAAMRNAKQIYFMGMGYHEQNMKLLMPTDNLLAHTIVGTGKDLSDMRCRLAAKPLVERSAVAPASAGDVIKPGRDCKQLFAEYSPLMENYGY